MATKFAFNISGHDGRIERAHMSYIVRLFLTFSKPSGDADLVLKMWARPLHE
jgi:hypothetical protein